METKKIDIGAIISTYIKNKGYAKIAVARKLERNKDVINSILKQKFIKSEDIYDFSLALQYNFFKEIADLLPNCALPLSKQEEAQLLEIEVLKKENEALKKEIEQLEKAIKLISDR
jgi:hypothetical protein